MHSSTEIEPTRQRVRARNLSCGDRKPTQWRSPTNGAILVIEDDESMLRLIRLYLEHAGYRALGAPDGTTGLELARNENPDLIVLDLNLPGIDGNDVCKILRTESEVPIIIVSARVDEEDRLLGFNLGADDYVTKPFSPNELMARINTVLRRVARKSEEHGQIDGQLKVGPYEIDLDTRTSRVGSENLILTPTEFQLLIYFLNSNGRTVSRHQIIADGLGQDFDGSNRTVDAHISNLRRKIEVANGGSRHLKSVYGIGYRFEAS